MVLFGGDTTGLNEKQLEFIASVLKKEGFEDAEVTIKAIGDVGDNYGSTVKRIIAEKDDRTFRTVAKVAPKEGRTAMADLSTNKVFYNEYLMYSQVLPKFTAMEEAAGIPASERLRYAKLYGALLEEPLEIILLEDLQVPGFALLSRFEPLPNEAINLVLKSFAKLHSCSFALRHQEPDTFNEFKHALGDILCLMAQDEKAELFFNSLTDDALTVLRSDKHKAVLQKHYGKMAETIRNLHKTEFDSRYSVIQQGDSWSNNIMFRLEGTTPAECCMIDYQLSRANSPAADVMYRVLTTSEMTTSNMSRRSDTIEESTAVTEDISSTLNDSSSMNNNVYRSSTADPGAESTEGGESGEGLAWFLISRACSDAVLANYLYWYLLIECEDHEGQDPAVRAMYLAVMRTFSHHLAKGNADHQRTRSFLARQQVFIDKLVKLVKTVTRESGNRNKKAERLQQLLADPDAFKFNFTNFEPMPFPLDPNVTIKGIVAKKASLFKSSLMPSKLTFLTTEGMEYEAIFKHGDDLRQDQLILQMITLMDKLLRRENLDLKLTPYKVLATSSKHGFLQFIESVTVAEALATEGSIQNFFRKYNPCEGAPYGIKPETMDTYIRSCAGYCVITYLLGVGDRHLDNLLLTKSGALFHIDFGYILGRDPKPLPPPMKLSKEMVEAMGGVHSEHYHEFKKQCYTAFLHLRRHANLMLNLFSLMVDASVPDIALEPDKAVKKVQDKLRLDLGDEEAVHYLQNLLDMSVTAVMAALVEHFHKFAQYWRK